PAPGNPGLARFRRGLISLLLLFLQEIISYRHRPRRRNPGVSAARSRKEQRMRVWLRQPTTRRRPDRNIAKLAHCPRFVKASPSLTVSGEKIGQEEGAVRLAPPRRGARAHVPPDVSRRPPGHDRQSDRGHHTNPSLSCLLRCASAGLVVHRLTPKIA